MSNIDNATDFALAALRQNRRVSEEELTAQFKITPTSAGRIIRHAEDTIPATFLPGPRSSGKAGRGQLESAIVKKHVPIPAADTPSERAADEIERQDFRSRHKAGASSKRWAADPLHAVLPLPARGRMEKEP